MLSWTPWTSISSDNAKVYYVLLNCQWFTLKSASFQCARDKSSIARKPEVHPKIFNTCIGTLNICMKTFGVKN